MFQFFKRKKGKKLVITAPMTGEALPITECCDEVFSSKALGNGMVIRPTKGDVVAPITGEIVQVADTVHAICIVGEDGLELLIHLGIDTVNLKGEGFTCFVKLGDKVKQGEKLATMDLALIQEKGYALDSPCVLLNEDQFDQFSFIPGEVTAGETTMISYEKRK